jgi:hypothetical protein
LRWTKVAVRRSTRALQNYGSSKTPLLYYVFDVFTIRGRDVTGERPSSRRELLEADVLPKLGKPIRASAVLEASLRDLIHCVKDRVWRTWSQSGKAAAMNRAKGISGSSKKGEVVARNRRRILEAGKEGGGFLALLCHILS